MIGEYVERLLFVAPFDTPIAPKGFVHVGKGTVPHVVNETGNAHQFDVLHRNGGNESLYVFGDESREMIDAYRVLTTRVCGGRVDE
tara:strand:+ start:1559 stop:1816 length:258 start_codon:yes stop_codon:yes gene_type:complete